MDGAEVMSMEVLIDVLWDGLADGLRLIPFLLITYVIMEYLEHKTTTKTRAVMRRAGRLGPLAGSIAGAFPQCGFSAAASSLYAGGILTTGTLIAVFLSTSDEMLPVFISESVGIRQILMILGIKVVLGAVTGFVVDFVFRFRLVPIRYKEIHTMCESEHCGCEEGIFKSAVKHTVKIFIFIFIITVILNLLISFFGEENLTTFISDSPFMGPVFAGVIGLIPNCASSVVITQLFLNHLISFGTMMSGLLVAAGVGLLVLFRTNKRWKENLSILGILYVSGVLWGIVIDLVTKLIS